VRPFTRRDDNFENEQNYFAVDLFRILTLDYSNYDKRFNTEKNQPNGGGN
jgi:hypothetical protein